MKKWRSKDRQNDKLLVCLLYAMFGTSSIGDISFIQVTTAIEYVYVAYTLAPRFHLHTAVGLDDSDNAYTCYIHTLVSQ